ncbi:MAG: phosphoglycerate kinase [Candidatus Babeliales bacterium]
MQCVSHLPTWDLTNQRVFVRADLNVPLINDMILDAHRLYTVLPTLDLILQKGGTIILATHIGRPTIPTEKLSTKVLLPWFKTHGYQIEYAATPQEATQKSINTIATIILLENLRFLTGEKKKELSFAQQLAACADYYVNDAFASLHRDDASIAIMPTLYTADKRSIGLLIQHELSALAPLKKPQQPFVLLIGGGKVVDKLPLLEGFLPTVSTILLCPAFIFSIMKAVGKPTGQSLIAPNSSDIIHRFLQSAKEQAVQIITPVDFQIARGSYDGPLSIVASDAIPHDGYGISVGPETIKLFAPHIKNAKTILYNCAMGFFDRPETLESTKKLLKMIALSEGYSVVAGGESVAAAHYFNVQQKIQYLTTGGGAVLTYLAGKKLPGLDILCPRH